MIAVSATAMLRYEGGAECVITAGRGEIGMILQDVTADVKSWKMTMRIDIGLTKGGSWKIGDQEGVFPAQKASPPQFASLNGTMFRLKMLKGRAEPPPSHADR